MPASLPILANDLPPRPRTRGDCENGPRPCPWYSCRFHLGLDINPKTGDLKLNPAQSRKAPPTCALDVAEKGPHRLEAVAETLGITRERVRQIEWKALDKLKETVLRLELHSPSPTTARSADVLSWDSTEMDLDMFATHVLQQGVTDDDA